MNHFFVGRFALQLNNHQMHFLKAGRTGFLLLTLFISVSLELLAQEPSFQILRATDKIKIDGELDEASWKSAEVVSNFTRQFPFDTGKAKSKTEVRLTYDAQFLYIAAECFDSPKGRVVWNLRRDFALKTNDNFSVVIDPYLDGTNGFNFAVSALGTQREALIQNGDGSFTIWDNRWFSHVHTKDDRWIVEMAIPFTTLRYNEGLDHWHFNFSRTDVSDNEISTWIPIPRNYALTVLSLSGKMIWDQPITKAGGHVSLIPYAGVNASQVFLPKAQPDKVTPQVGGDAKVAITSSLNLDLTVNPDFSNVEVDRQVSNLSRFEIFFPEQRQFFNENSDLFANSGFSRIRPFFSRRIGLTRNPDAPGFLPTRILYGARLSGKLNPGLRVGLLNVQTADQPSLDAQSTNYTVATFQQKVFGRSNLAGMLVNKQVFKNDSGDFSLKNNRYNRVIGLDYNLLSKDNRWSGKFFHHQSFENERKMDAFAHAAYLMYNVPTLSLIWNHEIVGKGYNPEVGYLQRPRGYFRIEPEVNYRYYYHHKKRNYLFAEMYADVYWDRHRNVTDQLYQPKIGLTYNSTATLSLTLNTAYTRLYNGGFDPSNTGAKKLDSNAVFRYNYAFLEYLSDTRKRFSVYTHLQAGQYFNGYLYQIDGSFSYRTGVWANWSLIYTYNDFRFPAPYTNPKFWLVGPKAELSLTKSHFVTVFLQYNQQADNINLNARYQWRFAPVSDFFLVYSENDLPSPLKVKNRSLVCKLVYWLNV